MNQNCSQNSVSWAQNIPKMRLRPWLCPGPTGGAYSAPPDPLAGFRVQEEREWGKGMGGERKGKGGLRRERGGEGVRPP